MRRWIRDKAKSILDRRYVQIADWKTTLERVDELSERLDSVTLSANLGASFVAKDDPRTLREMVFVAHRSAAETATAVAALSAATSIGDSFVATEDPHELRKRLFAAHRLATESAIGVESLLQSEILLWQAIDKVAVVDGSTSSGGVTGPDAVAT